jgi:hypothetical protein
MQTTLLNVGLACIIGAIVGGGLKAFGVEIPVFSSLRRQAALGGLGVLLAGGGMWLGRAPDPAHADLTRGTWTLVNSIDDGGTDWTNSTLKFTTQQKVKDGFRVAGYFEWRSRNLLVGKEQFDGHYDPAQSEIILEGTSVSQQGSDSANVLGKGSYSARLSSDGLMLTNGLWGTVAGVALPNVRGHWEATR